MTRSRAVYWLFMGAVAGAVLIALVGTALGYLLAAIWEGAHWIVQRCSPRPSGP